MTIRHVTMHSSSTETGTILVTSDGAPNEVSRASWGEELIEEPFGGLRSTPAQDAQPVWVRAAVIGEAQSRAARQIEEWALEPAIASDDVVLSFLMSDGSSQSLLLTGVDANDLAIALQGAIRSSPQELN